MFVGVEKWNVGDHLKRAFPKFEADRSHPRWVNGCSKIWKKSGVEKWNVGNRPKRVLAKFRGDRSLVWGVNGRSKFRTKNIFAEKWNVGDRPKRVLAKFGGDPSLVRDVNGDSKKSWRNFAWYPVMIKCNWRIQNRHCHVFPARKIAIAEVLENSGKQKKPKRFALSGPRFLRAASITNM